MARHAVDRALGVSFLTVFRARHAAESGLGCFNLPVLRADVTVGKVSVMCWLTVGRQLTDSWSTVGLGE